MPENKEKAPFFGSRSEVESWATKLPKKFLDCRTYGHRWDPKTAVWDAEYQVFDVTLICSRCRHERWQWVNKSGEVIKQGRVYPEGYLHKGMGRIDSEGRSVLRMESIRRMTNPTQGRGAA